MPPARWQEKCIVHFDADVVSFFEEHFKEPHRKCILISGLGFDPRTTSTVFNLSKVLGDRLTPYLIRENRSNPDPDLVNRSARHSDEILALYKECTIWDIQIFSDDNAVIGGREVIKKMLEVNISEYTDIIIDLSSMSVGVSFPIVKFVYEKVKNEEKGKNIHLTTTSNPELDSLIQAEPNDEISHIHGFNLPRLQGEPDRIRLWVPVLSQNKMEHLKLIHARIAPEDVCPVLPFPTDAPRKGDQIAWSTFSAIHLDSFSGLLENEWNLEPRNFIFADERTPLDIYRTIMRIDSERKPVFDAVGGSTLVLSPLGTKIPSIGVLMAAIEGNFPIIYVETLSYSMDGAKINEISEDFRHSHIWLYGRDAYKGDE